MRIRSEPTYVSLDVLVVRTTERAVLLLHENEQEWVPRSCIVDGDELDDADDVTIEMAEWKARDLGWEPES